MAGPLQGLVGKSTWQVAATAVALLAVVLASGCVRKQIRGTETSGLDRKLSTFAFIEEGDLVTFIVGTRATRYRGAEPYIPIEIGVANRGLRRLNLTRESFTLIDEDGNRYPAANPRELMESYDFLDLDRDRLAEIGAITNTKFSTFTRYGSKFSPTRQSRTLRTNVVRDRITLPKFGYALDFIYFPTPPGGVKDRKFELFLDSPDLEDPVFVKFEVR